MNKPFLYDLVDKAYHTVIDYMPDAVQDRDMASAFVLGGAGMYSIVKGLQWTSKNIMNRFVYDFDENWLPKLEKTCIVGMAVAPLVYSLIDPEGARAMVAHHPTYSSGMAGVWAGSIAGAVQDVQKRPLEDRLK